MRERRPYFPTTFDYVVGAIVLACIVILTIMSLPVHAQTVSPDGATITPASGGQLTTADGTWTFGTTPITSSGNPTLLNGNHNNGGQASAMEVVGGVLYANTLDAGWWVWNSVSGWNSTAAPPPVANGTADITCTSPTQNTDGSAIAGTQLPLKIYFYEGIMPGPVYRQISPAQSTCAYKFTNLENGVHYFAAVAVDAVGASSGGSNEASKAIGIPTPAAPTNLKVPSTAPIAWTISTTRNALVPFAVGTAKAAAKCDTTQSFSFPSVNGGAPVYRVALTDVDLLPNVTPLVVFTTCG